MHNNRIHSVSNVHPAPFGEIAGQTIQSFAMTMNVQEGDSAGAASRVGDAVCDSWFLYHNVWGGAFEYDAAQAAFAQTNVWTMRNVFADLAVVNNPAARATGHLQNHNMNASGFLAGSDWTTGSDAATLFVDWANGDYAPAGAVLFNRWTEPLASFDAAGAAMPADGSGAVGALQDPANAPVDETPPELGEVAALDPYATGPVEVAYSGATDSESGLAEVELWVRKAGGAWQATGLTSTESSGAFSYDGFSGDGLYYFALRATDAAGNATPAPSGDGAAQTFLDKTPPDPGVLHAPELTSTVPVTLSYEGLADSGSGLKEGRIWLKKGDGAWQDTGIVVQNAEGSIEFNGVEEDNAYAFYLQAVDNAGLASPEPTDALIDGE
jgi:hypothetical protein